MLRHERPRLGFADFIQRYKPPWLILQNDINSALRGLRVVLHTFCTGQYSKHTHITQLLGIHSAGALSCTETNCEVTYMRVQQQWCTVKHIKAPAASLTLGVPQSACGGLVDSLVLLRGGQ